MTESAHSLVPTVKDSPGGRVARYKDKSIRGEGAAAIYTRAPMLFDHFTDSAGLLGANFAAIAATTTATKFTTTIAGTGTASVAISKTASGGIATITTAPFSGVTSGIFVAGTQVIWEPEELGSGQKMLLEMRVRLNSLAGVEAFWGFADTVNPAGVTSSLFTVSSSSAGTLGANNSFAFGYSSVPTSGVLDQSGTTTNYFGTLSSVTGTTTVAVASTGVGGDTKFHVYNLLVDSAGNVDAFVDDVFVGYTQFVAASGAGLNPTIAFTPILSIYNVVTASKTIDCDWAMVATTMETGV